MRKTSSVSVLLLLISVGIIAGIACKSSNNKSKNLQQLQQEMPAPITDNEIDSLKRIQQLKRDSIQRNR
jgi:hypothetical protein